MKRKKIVKLVEVKTLEDFFGLKQVDVYKYYAKGIRLDFMYIVLNRDDLTTKEKKEYIYNTSMSDELKDNFLESLHRGLWF